MGPEAIWISSVGRHYLRITGFIMELTLYSLGIFGCLCLSLGKCLRLWFSSMAGGGSLLMTYFMEAMYVLI